jgi:hypothetical protein
MVPWLRRDGQPPNSNPKGLLYVMLHEKVAREKRAMLCGLLACVSLQSLARSNW